MDPTVGIFYATGCKSLDELVQSCREWTPRNRRRMEHFFGMDSSQKWENDEDVVATSNMTEDEEVEYFKQKYAGGDEVWGSSDETGTRENK